MDSIQKTFVTSPIRQLLGAEGKNQGACSTRWNFSRTSADCRRDSSPEERTDQVNSMTNTRQLKKHTECFNCSRTYFDRFFEACPHCGSDSVLHYSSEEMNYFCREAREPQYRLRSPDDDIASCAPVERMQRPEPRGTPCSRASSHRFSVGDTTAQHAICGGGQPFSRIRPKRIRM